MKPPCTVRRRLIRKYQQRHSAAAMHQRRERHGRAACRTAMQQREKAVAEHVNTDQQRQNLQKGSQCADADGRVLQNIEHDRKRQCLKARCKAEMRGSCGKDQHQRRPERQNARTAACRACATTSGIDQRYLPLPRPDRWQCVPLLPACARCLPCGLLPRQRLPRSPAARRPSLAASFSASSSRRACPGSAIFCAVLRSRSSIFCSRACRLRVLLQQTRVRRRRSLRPSLRFILYFWGIFGSSAGLPSVRAAARPAFRLCRYL